MLTELLLCVGVWANLTIIGLYLKAVVDVRVHPWAVEDRYQLYMNERMKEIAIEKYVADWRDRITESRTLHQIDPIKLIKEVNALG